MSPSWLAETSRPWAAFAVRAVAPRVAPCPVVAETRLVRTSTLAATPTVEVPPTASAAGIQSDGGGVAGVVRAGPGADLDAASGRHRDAVGRERAAADGGVGAGGPEPWLAMKTMKEPAAAFDLATPSEAAAASTGSVVMARR